MRRVPLPPLPPLPAAAERDARPGGRGMLEILADEHERLLDLVRTDLLRTVRAGGGTSALTAGLVRHLSAEEQYLYPTVRAVVPAGDRLADAEVAADAVLRRALRDRAWGEVVRALRGHVERCDRRLFPALRAALDETALIRLGNRVVIAEEAAPTRPHPGTPYTPPWNRLVEPAVGALDKVRDALTGRPTRFPTPVSGQSDR